MFDGISSSRKKAHRISANAGLPLESRQDLALRVGGAIDAGRAFAMGKIGWSEKQWLYYPVVLSRVMDLKKRRAYETMMAYLSVRQAGIFPPDPGFIRRFVDRYLDDLRNLDSLGLFLDNAARELEIIREHAVRTKLAYYRDQEPPKKEYGGAKYCYLQNLQDRKILIVCPFGGFLASRLKEGTYEAVWRKTAKRWFYPRSVQAIEFPYGFEATTRKRYTDALQLFEEITDQMKRVSYDVALIGAGGLGIPLASFAKNQGKVGLSLGGHLQVVCGVLGKRWRTSELFRRRYITEAWVELPRRYHPSNPLESTDSGDYW